MDDDGGEEDGQVQVKLVADKLVWGRQLIQVITFPPSGIGPRHLWSTAALCSAVGDVGEARALPEAGAALMWDFSIDDFCLRPTLGRYTFAAGTG